MDDTTRDLLAQIQRMAIELDAVTRDRDFWRHEALANSAALDHAVAAIHTLRPELRVTIDSPIAIGA